MKIFEIPFPTKKFDGIALGDNIFIREGMMRPTILAHEKTHVEQWQREKWLFYFRYLFSKKARAHYEAEAYANQLRASPLVESHSAKLEHYAERMVKHYNLNLTLKQAMNLILKYYM